ncbi:MAG: hypothetical protein U0457_06330 [Candidatus Sericytochromatia bacterium]
MTTINNSNSQISLVSPDQLFNNTKPANQNNPATNPNITSCGFGTDNINVVPQNYPQVGNTIPANIFPTSTQTQPTGTIPTTNTTIPTNTGTTTTTQPTGTNTTLKPISMSEAQWAVKFEEKVKKGYQPTPQELAKYQDIAARFKANPKVDSSILEILAAQSSSLGAQVASTKYGKDVAAIFKGMKNGGNVIDDAVAAETGTISGAASGLKGLGGTLLKGTGLSAIVAGGFSLVTNGIMVMQGKKTWSDVGGTIAADTANGAVSGLTGTLAAGGATLLAGALGATGLVSGLIVGVGAMGGAWLGDKLFKGTGLYDKIKDKVDDFFRPKPQVNTFQ